MSLALISGLSMACAAQPQCHYRILVSNDDAVGTWTPLIPAAATLYSCACSRLPTAARLGATASSLFPSTRYMVRVAVLPRPRSHRREQQAAFEYAKTGFSHGPMGMWRDEHLLKQMVAVPLQLRRSVVTLIRRTRGTKITECCSQ